MNALHYTAPRFRGPYGSMPIKNLKELRDRFRLFGVDTIYIKRLSAKQDSDKNQIDLGSGLDGITNTSTNLL